MKIAAISEDETTISQHFGRAPYYMVYTEENGEIIRKEKRDKAGHHTFGSQDEERTHSEDHGFGAMAQSRHAAMASAIQDCAVVIVGGMGRGAFESMKSYDIDTIVTDAVNIEEALARYFKGDLPNLMERLH